MNMIVENKYSRKIMNFFRYFKPSNKLLYWI